MKDLRLDGCTFSSSACTPIPLSACNFHCFFRAFHAACCPSKSPQNATRTAATNDQRRRWPRTRSRLRLRLHFLLHSKQKIIINKFIRRGGSSKSCGIHKRLLITRSLATVSLCRRRRSADRVKESERAREKESGRGRATVASYLHLPLDLLHSARPRRFLLLLPWLVVKAQSVCAALEATKWHAASSSTHTPLPPCNTTWCALSPHLTR